VQAVAYVRCLRHRRSRRRGHSRSRIGSHRIDRAGHAVGPTTATVSGSVNPNGTATTWHVEYGTTTSYGTPTAGVSAGSGTASVAVSQTLTGLTPGTSYHYRIVATSTAGTGHGADGLLTTSAAPQVVTGTRPA